MQDLQGRQVDYLRLSVTQGCNFRCQYCVTPGEPGVQTAPPTIERLDALVTAAVACGVRKVRLTGGEPLSRRDIVPLCGRIAQIPGVEELCITTNGSGLSALAEPLRRAGVHRLNISIDSLQPQRFATMTGGGSLETVWAGILAAQDAGFTHLKLDTVLIGGINDEEVPDFVALTQRYPWEVRFIELMPMGPCAHWPAERFISCHQVMTMCPDLEPLPSEGVARRYRLPQSMGTVGLISPLSHGFCATCNRIRITADQCLKGCLHAREEIGLEGLEGQALETAIAQGIVQKPPQHHLNQGGSQSQRPMHQIGG